jgi:hypothetical protein
MRDRSIGRDSGMETQDVEREVFMESVWCDRDMGSFDRGAIGSVSGVRKKVQIQRCARLLGIISK